MATEFEEWYQEKFGKYPNYMTPLMKEHARYAWYQAWTVATNPVKHLVARPDEEGKQLVSVYGAYTGSGEDSRPPGCQRP